MNVDKHIDNRNENDPPTVPARLVAALKAVTTPDLFIPPAIDNAILNVARVQLGGPHQSRRAVVPRWFWIPFATACLILIVYLVIPTAQPAFAGADVNRDGQIDILDAFQVARAAGDPESLHLDLDFNHDGVIDRRDAEVIAARVVTLQKGGGS